MKTSIKRDDIPIPIKVFVRSKVATKYCINLSKEEMLAVLDYDNNIYNDPLVYILEGMSMEGVRDVEYDGHFGPHIFLTIDAEHDNRLTWRKIERAIAKVCYKEN